MKVKEFFKKNKEDIKFIFYSIFLLGIIFLLGMAMGISLTCSIFQDLGYEVKDEQKENMSYTPSKCTYENNIETYNITEDYEVIERINFIDDNWEFTALPFTTNDNWNEYGIHFYFVIDNDIISGISYISSCYVIEEMQGDELYYNRFYSLIYLDVLQSIDFKMIINDFYYGQKVITILSDGITGWQENTESWVELIRCVPNIDTSYQNGYDEGYDLGFEEGTEQAPTITKNPLLDATYIVYDDGSQIMETDILTENDFMSGNHTRPHVLWDIMRVNDTQYNRIMFDVINFSTEDGYILKIDNETTSELNFILKIYNAFGYVIYQNEYLLNTPNFQFDFRNINIVDTIGYIELEFINDSINNFDDTTIGFNNTILTESYNLGYKNGYNNGYVKGDEEGYSEGYDVGYDHGYVNGAEDLSIIPNSLVSISQIPINIITSLLNFELLGLNFLDFFKGIFTVLVVILVIKIFI